MAAWDVAYARLRTYLGECSLHARRLAMARERVAALLPIDEQGYESLDFDAIEHIDWLFYRFIKLQDALGRKLFPQLLIVADDDEEWASRPMIDILNRLEKYGYLPDTWEWRELRYVRNLITHEYETVPKRAVEGIVSVYEKSAYLIDLLKNIENRVAKEELS